MVRSVQINKAMILQSGQRLYKQKQGAAISEYIPLVSLIVLVSLYGVAELGYVTAENFAEFNAQTVDCCQLIYYDTDRSVIYCVRAPGHKMPLGRLERFGNDHSRINDFIYRQREMLIQRGVYGSACPATSSEG